MEARIQIEALPAVGCADLFSGLLSFGVRVLDGNAAWMTKSEAAPRMWIKRVATNWARID
jgi:hypothetical protein